MDWTSKEGRKLLWSAYPGGLLPVGGVLSIGYYRCLAAHDAHNPRVPHQWLSTWHKANQPSIETEDEADPCGRWQIRTDGSDVMHALQGGIVEDWENGELLPWPNPADPATWAALLSDLAQANPDNRVCTQPASHPPFYGLLWERNVHRVWQLVVVPHPTGTCDCGSVAMTRRMRNFYHLTEIDDPAEALVAARAALRARKPWAGEE